MTLDKDRIRLSQDEPFEDLLRPYEIPDMVTVYQRPSESSQDYCVDSFLIPTEILRHPTSHLDWDWEYDLVGVPLFVDPTDKRLLSESGSYGFRANYRFNDRVKRLVLPRRLNAVEKRQIEIYQEFCLFHELHSDEETGNYRISDDEGNNPVVVRVEPNRVKIRYKEIRGFLRHKRMYLSLRFDYREHSVYSLHDLGFSKNECSTVLTESLQDGFLHCNRFYSNNRFDKHWTQGEGLQAHRLRTLFAYDETGIEGEPDSRFQKSVNIFYHTGDVGDPFWLSTPNYQVLLPLRILRDNFVDVRHSYSALYGRRLIGSGDIPKQESVAFIIAVDEYGTEITRAYETYKHETFVHFHKRVLDKYYHYYQTYFVGDTFLICQDHGAWLPNTKMGIWLTGDPRFLSCHGQWFIRIDDDHDDKVCVLLQELWKLPPEEQRHWRAHNIPPEGNISETYSQRYERYQSTSSSRLEHLFRESYYRLQETCKGKPKWEFLIGSLNTKNEYHLRCLRIPSDRDMEYNLFLSLQIILNESLKLRKEKNRNKFRGVEGSCKHIDFLEKLDRWRNEWDGHVGHNDYLTGLKKMRKDFGVKSPNLQAVYTQVLRAAVDLLNFLNKVVSGNQS